LRDEFEAFLEPITIPIHLQDMTLMGESMEKSGSETLIAENLCPSLKFKVVSDDHRPFEVAV
jgi:hypothetical protein